MKRLGSWAFGLDAPWWRTVIVLVVFVAIFATVLTIVAGGNGRQSPDDFCAGHGGVRYLSAGGWATPDAATCRDGHAGNVYP